MPEPQVYELQMQPGDATLWADAETRKMIIIGGIEQAKDLGCRLLRVLDTEGKQLHLEGFGPRLWDLVREAHDGIEEKVAHVKLESKAVHALLQEALHAFERGDVPASHVLLQRAMDKEFDVLGECAHTGDDALLEAFGYDIERDMPLMSMG